MSQTHRQALPKGYMLQEYQVDRVLGAGGFGLTYLGWDTALDKPVAIKEYLPALSAEILEPLADTGTGDTVLHFVPFCRADFDWRDTE